jgi:DNA repair photolyase
MVIPVPLLTADEVARLPQRARQVVEYRKSGLSLHHIQGCPADCAYCIRHTYGIWDMRQPRALVSDAEAVEQLVNNRYFQPHITPIQVFNRATDPFVPRVKAHTFAVLEDLDRRGLRNHVLVITRYRVTPEDCAQLNTVTNVKLTLLFTYSGITDTRLEPFSSVVAETSLRTAASLARRYRTVFYWRPLVPGVNDTPEHVAKAIALSRIAHATVFTGLFYRAEMPSLRARVARCSGKPPALYRSSMACRTTMGTTACEMSCVTSAHSSS